MFVYLTWTNEHLRFKRCIQTAPWCLENQVIRCSELGAHQNIISQVLADRGAKGCLRCILNCIDRACQPKVSQANALLGTQRGLPCLVPTMSQTSWMHDPVVVHAPLIGLVPSFSLPVDFIRHGRPPSLYPIETRAKLPESSTFAHFTSRCSTPLRVQFLMTCAWQQRLAVIMCARRLDDMLLHPLPVTGIRPDMKLKKRRNCLKRLSATSDLTFAMNKVQRIANRRYHLKCWLAKFKFNEHPFHSNPCQEKQEHDQQNMRLSHQ